MSMSAQGIVEEAIVRACRSKFQQLTAGLSPEDKASLIDFALVELDKLRSSDQMPDYRKPAVGLFYALWYLPSQINLAHHLLIENLDFDRGGNIIDFGAGPGTVSLALAMAFIDSGRSEPIYVHEIDVDVMGQLGELIWKEVYEVLRECNKIAPALLGHIHRYAYPNAEALYRHHRWRSLMNGGTPRAVAALHVVYGENWDSVRPDVEKLWTKGQPDWGVFTAPDFPGKAERLAALSFLTQSEGVRPLLSKWGNADRITNLRQNIRKECPPAWKNAWLLEKDVTWQFESAKPVVYRPSVKADRRAGNE